MLNRMFDLGKDEVGIRDNLVFQLLPELLVLSSPNAFLSFTHLKVGILHLWKCQVGREVDCSAQHSVWDSRLSLGTVNVLKEPCPAPHPIVQL